VPLINSQILDNYFMFLCFIFPWCKK